MEPLRRKLNNNITAQSNSRRIGGGNELIKLGHKLTTELPRTIDDEKSSYNNNSSILNNNTAASSSIMVLPSSKASSSNGNLVGSIISRAAAAQ